MRNGNVLTRTRGVRVAGPLDFAIAVAPEKPLVVPMPSDGPLPPAVRVEDPIFKVAPTSTPETVVLLGKEVGCGDRKTANALHSAFDLSIEKFADPIWNCIGEGKGGDRLAYLPMYSDGAAATLERLGLPAGGIGVEYLAPIPNNARARIAAIRKKITAHTGKNLVVLQMREASQSAIRKMALNLISLYKDPTRSGELIEKYRDIYQRSVTEIGDDLKKVERIVKMSPPELQAQLQDLLKGARPMIEEMRRGISEFASKVVGSTASASSSLLSSLGSAVPIAGAVIAAASAMYDMARAQIHAEEEARKKDCNKTLQDAIDFQKYTMDLGMPIPWHAIEFGAHDMGPFYHACDSATDPFGLDPWPVLAFDAAIYNNLVRLYCLPLDLQQDIIKWWSHVNAMMADVQIAHIFDAIGSDALGGMLASDEQVMLVAAPIAAANGLPIDEFAVALWNKSRGWTARKDLLRRQPDKRWAARSLEDAKLKWEIIDGLCMNESPDNAMQVQWGVLAHDAFVLLEETKKAGRIPPMYLSGVDSASFTRSGTIPGRSGPAPGSTMASWSTASDTDKTKGGIGTLAIVGGILLGGIMLLRGGHA